MNINKIIKEEYNHAKYLKWKRQNVTLRGIKNLGQDNEVYGSFGKGLYTVPLSNKAMAKTYGTVYFVLNAIPKNPKVVQDRNSAEIWIQTLINNFSKKHGREYDVVFFEENTTIEDEMQKLGYDGIIIKGREMVNYNPPDDVMYFENENQLMMFYENSIMNLNEIKNTNLFEGRYDYDEIDKLSTYVLNELIHVVINKIIELYHNNVFPLSDEILSNFSKLDDLNKSIFDMESNSIKLRDFYNNEFKILGDFLLKTPSEVYFKKNENSFDMKNKEIKISVPDSDLLKLINNKIKKLIKRGKTSDNQLKTLLYNEIINSNFLLKTKSSIQHEIQHAFDDYRSNSKIFNSKEENSRQTKISNYFDKYYNNDNFNRNDVFNTYRKEYYNSPHEIWAFFTTTINKLFGYGQQYDKFEDLVKLFKSEYDGDFNILTKKNKMKLLTALYKKYKNYNNNINEEMEDLNKTKKMYVLVGPPSVGKSTWIKSLNNNNIVVINRDEIVEEVAKNNGLTYDEIFINPSSETSEIGDKHLKYGEVIQAPPHMKWTELAYSRLVKINGYIHYLLTTKIEQAVNSDKDIVVDMTNMNKNSRKRALKYLGDKSDEYKKIAVVFKFQGSEDIIKKVASIRAQQYKDMGKSKTIGDDVFDVMFKSYEEPTMEEGFDNIIYVDNIKQLKLIIDNDE